MLSALVFASRLYRSGVQVGPARVGCLSQSALACLVLCAWSLGSVHVGGTAHPSRLTAPHYERSEALTSIDGTEFNSPVDSLERTGRPRRSGLDRQCMALSDSSLLCSGKLMFPCIRRCPQRVASLSRWSGLALNNELFRPLRWGNGRGPADPSGSASAPRASPGLSQSSDSHLPKGRGPLLL